MFGPVGGLVGSPYDGQIRRAVRLSDEDRGYELTHILARYQLGLLDRGLLARGVACVECGITDLEQEPRLNQAMVAALAWKTADRGNLRMEGYKIWSIQIDDYVPMCRSCHSSYDSGGWAESVGFFR